MGVGVGVKSTSIGTDARHSDVRYRCVGFEPIQARWRLLALDRYNTHSGIKQRQKTKQSKARETLSVSWDAEPRVLRLCFVCCGRQENSELRAPFPTHTHTAINTAARSSRGGGGSKNKKNKKKRHEARGQLLNVGGWDWEMQVKAPQPRRHRER